MDTMECPQCAGEGHEYRHIPQESPLCDVCNGKGWVISEWGTLWQAMRTSDPLVYQTDYCDGCDTVRPVVRIRGCWLCADCAAAVLSEAARWASLTRAAWAGMALWRYHATYR